MLLARRHTLPNCLVALFSRRNPLTRARRTFVQTTSYQHAEPLHAPDASNVERTTITQVDPRFAARDGYTSTARRHKYNALLDSLHGENVDPDWTWTCYVGLLDFTRDELLPLEIHQNVLRRCTPEPRAMRNSSGLRLRVRQRARENPHRYEGRFLTVINNIRRAGNTPMVDDYEFILTQFAAVGHYIGAAQVLQEIVKTGLEPRTKTFNLCLQAIAHRLSLPCREKEKEKLHEQCSRLCLHIASLIRKRKQRVPSACLDLILRVMKDTEQVAIFRSLLKMAYGIDLDYLDRHPIIADGGLGEPEPFSTTALTTLVDFLGQEKEVSKMVAAFEVLTTPLIISPSEVLLRNFDDEDDDDYSAPVDSPRPLPSAQPNTTTYNTLIRHCTILRETTLAKHYVMRALEDDYSSTAQLQSDIQSLPLADIRAPQFKVNVDTFRPILGLGKRNNDLALVKWLLPHFRMTVRRKKQDLEYYSSILDQPDTTVPQPAYARYFGGFLNIFKLADPTASNPPRSQDAKAETLPDNSGEPSVTFFTPSSSTPLPPSPVSSDDQTQQKPLDVSLEPVSSHARTRLKRFELAQYVEDLRRDVREMRQLDGRLGSALSRMAIRRKERLGRRIWAGKGVYVRDKGERVIVSREDWMEMVNFGGARPSSKPLDSSEVQNDSKAST